MQQLRAQKQFLPAKGPSGSSTTSDALQQSCAVSVLDFATPLSPQPPEHVTDADMSPTPGPGAERAGPHHRVHRIPELYVDRVLERARKAPSMTRPPAENLSFLRCLGHERVNELVGRIAGVIEARLRDIRLRGSFSTRQADKPACLDNKELLSKYARLYFERVHPRFPFLDRAAFEATAASQDKPNAVPRSKPWVCLYHTVLALGCQYDGGGSFEPGQGESWKLFSVALANFTELILLPDSLTTLQAVTAMAIYSLGVCGIALEQVFMSEAARRAQNLADARFVGPASDAYRRTFWVLYSLEKITCFHHGRTSGIADCEISCPIPNTSNYYFAGEFDWFLAFVSHSRLLSRASTSLFSVGVSDRSNEYFLDIIDQLTEELEEWRKTLPDNGLRPGGWVKVHSIVDDDERTVALVCHFLYFSFLLTISRMNLKYLPMSEDSSTDAERESCMKVVGNSARSLLELTTLIEISPCTPMWMMAGIPISAFFVLFDLVIHNPRQQETATNLALLDVVTGHCSRMEIISNGQLPGSLIGEFAYIARSYVNEANGRSPTGNTPQASANTSLALSCQPQWTPPQNSYGTPSNEIYMNYSSVGSSNYTSVFGILIIL
ncbi:Protein STB5-like protein 1 [Colletotrichum chlorophyti]|uniref:Protein STB5-like protein 1 n=1 Tax=Colletotrichum chlorophyti TaxID=708187 RepID=A0A1Q8RPL9_9PEZI|nr:Protein STB5-like protein 1 [Colletotrichum chlorophyti]